ncbi:MAG: YIP1 family protein [Smithella sp.]|nr:YIP1 family protein [Smithella sp.]
MEPKEINFAAMPQTAVNVVARPAEFFQSMPKTGGFLEPLVFVIAMGVITGVVQVILNFAGLGYSGPQENSMMARLSFIVFMPVAAAIGSFIGAAFLFVIWKIMGSSENYETAYRCGAYLMALSPITTVIGAIPYAGGILSMAIYVYYLVMASVYVHDLPAQKAWIVFGIIGAIFVFFGLFAERSMRHMDTDTERWRKMGEHMSEEYRQPVTEMEQSSEAMRKQAEEMVRQLQQQAQETTREAPENQ